MIEFYTNCKDCINSNNIRKYDKMYLEKYILKNNIFMNNSFFKELKLFIEIQNIFIF